MLSSCKILCPFCNAYLYEDNIVFYCRDCNIAGRSKYLIELSNRSNGHILFIRIIFKHNEEEYMVQIHYTYPYTRVEKVKTGIDLTFLQVSFIEVNYAMPFDFNDPILSGQKILTRLLNLRAFD